MLRACQHLRFLKFIEINVVRRRTPFYEVHQTMPGGSELPFGEDVLNNQTASPWPKGIRRSHPDTGSSAAFRVVSVNYRASRYAGVRAWNQ